MKTDTPPTAKPTTGMPRAIASTPASPNGSCQRDGNTASRTFPARFHGSGSKSTNSTRPRKSGPAITASSSFRSRLRPITTARPGCRTRANARKNRSAPLPRRIWPTNTAAGSPSPGGTGSAPGHGGGILCSSSGSKPFIASSSSMKSDAAATMPHRRAAASVRSNAANGGTPQRPDSPLTTGAQQKQRSLPYGFRQFRRRSNVYLCRLGQQKS